MNEPQVEISRVAIRPPAFWKANPKLWFSQIEAQFNIAKITADETKFNHVVAAIESDILSAVQDIVLKPPETDKYECLKNRLISIFSESEHSKLRKLLQGLELGDERPSQLLSRMRDLSSNNFTDDALKSLWLTRLPTNIQAILAVSTESLSQLAIMADKIHEFSPNNQVSAVQQSSTVPSVTLEAQILELSKQINELSAAFYRQGRSRSRNRYSRSPSRTAFSRSNSKNRHETRRRYLSPTNGLCFYHTNFGEKANKCVNPCNYKQNSEN